MYFGVEICHNTMLSKYCKINKISIGKSINECVVCCLNNSIHYEFFSN